MLLAIPKRVQTGFVGVRVKGAYLVIMVGSSRLGNALRFLCVS